MKFSNLDLLELFKLPVIVGHRGYPNKELENTLPSIEAAIEHGADIVEVDIQSTLDGVLVISHDESLERTFGVSVNIRESVWKDIKKIKKGKYTVPTLSDVLKTVSGRVGLFVEIKHPEDTEKVVKAIHEAKAEKWTAVISFHEEVLKDLNLYKGLVYSKPPGKILEAKEIGCQLVLPKYYLATEKANAFAHRMGLYVVAWTVNNVDTAVKLWKSGVNGIATDDVELIKSSLIWE
jgi:glycerophosphoryl diester phosphodiesterase